MTVTGMVVGLGGLVHDGRLGGVGLQPRKNKWPRCPDEWDHLPMDSSAQDVALAALRNTVALWHVNEKTAGDVVFAACDVLVSGIDGIALAELAAVSSFANDFSGKGGTEAANTFTGSITATVINVLPNGNLVVAGEKQIGVNQNVDVLRFSGTVDPRVVQPGSVVSSTQVANARIESRGRGAQAEAGQGRAGNVGRALARAEARHGLKSMLFAPELALARAWTNAARRDRHGAVAAAREAFRAAERGGQSAVALRALYDAARLGDARAADCFDRVGVDCAFGRRARVVAAGVAADRA